MKKSTLLLLIIPCSLFAQNNDVQRYIDEKLKCDSIMKNTITGIYAVDHNDNVIAEWNADFPMLTASTMKTITTGTALELLGPEFRFETSLAYDGYLKDSTLFGNLYIIGGGDPTLGSTDTIATPLDTTFLAWANAVKCAGINRIEGFIVADDSFFADEVIPSSWSWGNISASYGSAPSGLIFYENKHTFTLRPGAKEGDCIDITSEYPSIPGMVYLNTAVTAEKGRGNRVSYYVSDLARVAKFEGTLALDRSQVKMESSNKFAPLSCAWHFKDYLKQYGVVCNDEVFTARDFPAIERENLVYISSTYSPALITIINVTNRVSNNLYAETLLKMVGKEMTGVGCYDSCYVAIDSMLSVMEVAKEGFTMSDGSGLSRQNYVSPRFFTNFYKQMEKSKYFDLYLNSLPVPGGPGTLSTVLRSEPESVKKRIHAKSGSLAGVRCYAGYVEANEGLIRFAILVNNYSTATSKVQPLVEGFMKELAIYSQTK